MKIATRSIRFQTKGFTDIIDITPEIQNLLNDEELEEGSVLISAIGSTTGITTLEYEPGLVNHDIAEMLDKLAPVAKILRHHAWPRLQCWLAKYGRPHRVFHPLFLHAVVSRPIFVRGFCETPNGNILVGISPAAILELDWKSGELVDFFTYSDAVGVCVHGLACRKAG